MLQKLLWIIPLTLLVGLVYLVGAALTAPPQSSPPPPVVPQFGYPVTITESDGRKVVIKQAPKRIIATNAGLADVLVELVHIDRLAAMPTTVTEFGGAAQWYRNHPEITLFEKATAENLLALDPDLVLWSGFQEETAVRVLEQRGITVLRFEFYKSFEGIRASLLAIGAAVGEPERTQELVTRFDHRLVEIGNAVDSRPKPRVLSYSNYGTGFAVGTGESQDEIVRRAGGKNIAQEMGKVGHFNVSFEQIIQLNPDWLVVSGDQGLNSPQAKIILNEPSLAEVSAVKNKRIAVIPDRYYSNINHYVATAVEILARQLHPEAFTKLAPMDKVPPGHL